MCEQQTRRFEVVVEEGPPRGDLYELEQTTYYRVVDRRSGQVVVTFEGQMEASLSTTTGMWEDSRLSGVAEVSIAPDEQTVVIKYHDGGEATAPLCCPCAPVVPDPKGSGISD
jgi:hypothetical protein